MHMDENTMEAAKMLHVKGTEWHDDENKEYSDDIICRATSEIIWTNQEGFPLLEPYIWDVGEDESLEQLIDKAIRLLLLHPTFVEKIWKNKDDNLKQLYNDKSFGEIVSKVHHDVMNICEITFIQEIKRKQIKTETRKATTRRTISMAKNKNSHVQTALELASINDEIKANINAVATAGKMQGIRIERGTETTSSQASINNKKSSVELVESVDDGHVDEQFRLAESNNLILSYKDLKEMNEKFGIKTGSNGNDERQKELYLWSFLLSLACTIKYLEIEIISTPIFDDVEFQDGDEYGPPQYAPTFSRNASNPFNRTHASSDGNLNGNRNNNNNNNNNNNTENDGTATASGKAEIKQISTDQIISPQLLNVPSPNVQASNGARSSFQATQIGSCAICGTTVRDLKWEINKNTACEQCMVSVCCCFCFIFLFVFLLFFSVFFFVFVLLTAPCCVFVVFVEGLNVFCFGPQ